MHKITTTTWEFNISEPIWIYSQSGLPANFSSLEKSIVRVPFGIHLRSYHAHIFGVIQRKFSKRILESLRSFHARSLLLKLSFFSSYSALICTWGHYFEQLSKCGFYMYKSAVCKRSWQQLSCMLGWLYCMQSFEGFMNVPISHSDRISTRVYRIVVPSDR